jgi:peptidoglycan/LPS O-acetylase OafA/YrhL
MCHIPRRTAGGGVEERMNRETSVYLDLVRFVAAVFVFLTHAGWQQVSGGLLWQISYGREAVDVFFVLSGFVIGHVVETRERSALGYAVARAARLYSVALPAVALTFVLDRIGQSLRPELYVGWCCDALGSRAWEYLGSLVFLNEIWSHHAPPGSALPYWSLGFEVWYYVAFGLAFFAPRPWNLVAAALVLVAVGPGIAVLFPLWLLGFYCYRLCTHRLPGRGVGALLCVGALITFFTYEHWAYRYGELYAAFALSPERLHDYAQDYIVGGLFSLHLIGFCAVSAYLAPLLARCERPIRWIAGATFTLYLFHVPLLHVVVALAPWPVETWPTRALVFIGVPLLVLALAEVTERRKAVWRRGILAVLSKQGWAPPRPARGQAP